MNYIWEIEQMVNDGLATNVKYKLAKGGSPYMELSLECLNQIGTDEDNVVYVNPLYRFEKVFRHFFIGELDDIGFLEDIDKTKDELFHRAIEYLARMDIVFGKTEELFCQKFMLNESSLNNCTLFEEDEKKVIADGLLTLYKTGEGIKVFRDVLKKIWKDAYIYEHKEGDPDLYVYVEIIDDLESRGKIDFVSSCFLPFNMNVKTFYMKHFCIMGNENTEVLGDFVVC